MCALRSLATGLSSKVRGAAAASTATRGPTNAASPSWLGQSCPRRWLSGAVPQVLAPFSSFDASIRPSSFANAWGRFEVAGGSPLGCGGGLVTSANLSAFSQLKHRMLQQWRGSKYLSKSAKKRLVLTTKRARKGFYKGKGCTTEGRLTSTGKFVVDPLKRLQLVVPDLTAFKLKPYIASTVPRFPPEEQHNPLPR